MKKLTIDSNCLKPISTHRKTTLESFLKSLLKTGRCCILEASGGCKNKFMLKLKHIYTAVHQNKTRRFPLLLRLLKSPQINIQILLRTVRESGQPEVKFKIGRSNYTTNQGKPNSSARTGSFLKNAL